MSHLRQLGYLVAETQHMDRWRELTLDGLGFAPGSGPNPDGLYLRMDERPYRLALLPGGQDRVLAIGWEVRDQYALAQVSTAVTAGGVVVTEGSPELAEERGVERLITFRDPGGTPTEVFFGPRLDHSPVRTGYAQRFVTDDMGMGHVVIPTMDVESTVDFYAETLGFLPRGAFRMRNGKRLRFMGINERHHSLAIAAAPHGEAPGLVHLMVEVDEIDTVGRALDRVNQLGFGISSTLGRHTNDKMISFYVRAPGGWDVEYGCEGARVDERYYTAEEITADSYWGHDWSGSEVPAAFQTEGL